MQRFLVQQVSAVEEIGLLLSCLPAPVKLCSKLMYQAYSMPQITRVSPVTVSKCKLAAYMSHPVVCALVSADWIATERTSVPRDRSKRVLPLRHNPHSREWDKCNVFADPPFCQAWVSQFARHASWVINHGGFPPCET